MMMMSVQRSQSNSEQNKTLFCPLVPTPIIMIPATLVYEIDRSVHPVFETGSPPTLVVYFY